MNIVVVVAGLLVAELEAAAYAVEDPAWQTFKKN